MPTWVIILIVVVVLAGIGLTWYFLTKKPATVAAPNTSAATSKTANITNGLTALSGIFGDLSGFFNNSSSNSGVNGSDQSGVTAAQVDTGETATQTAANDQQAANDVLSFLG